MLADEPGWLCVDTARSGTIRVIAVTLGPAARVAIFDLASGERLQVPTALMWLYRLHPHPQFTADQTLLLISDTVQAAGLRVGLQVDSLRRVGDGYQEVQSLEHTFNLDSAWPEIAGNQIRITSVDEPQSFYTSQADTLFTRTETFSIAAGRIRCVAEHRQDALLRAVDAWMAAARKARHPNRWQRVIRQALPEPSMIYDCHCKALSAGRTQVDMQFDNVLMRFEVTLTPTRYSVTSVRMVQGGR
jgi:hypothetical protein